jgi:hypothetical protein
MPAMGFTLNPESPKKPVRRRAVSWRLAGTHATFEILEFANSRLKSRDYDAALDAQLASIDAWTAATALGRVVGWYALHTSRTTRAVAFRHRCRR